MGRFTGKTAVVTGSGRRGGLGEAIVRQLAAEGAVLWIEKRWEPSDLDGMYLVITATNDPAVNQAVYQAATEKRILCNSVDDVPNCDFYFGSVVNRGDLQIAISTAGQSSSPKTSAPGLNRSATSAGNYSPPTPVASLARLFSISSPSVRSATLTLAPLANWPAHRVPAKPHPEPSPSLAQAPATLNSSPSKLCGPSRPPM